MAARKGSSKRTARRKPVTEGPPGFGNLEPARERAERPSHRWLQERCGSCVFFERHVRVDSGMCRRFPRSEPKSYDLTCGEWQPA